MEDKACTNCRHLDKNSDTQPCKMCLDSLNKGFGLTYHSPFIPLVPSKEDEK